MPKKEDEGVTSTEGRKKYMKRILVMTTDSDQFDWQLKFDNWWKTEAGRRVCYDYVELIPISKRYKGKVIKSRSLRWYNKDSWDRMVVAVNMLQDWIEKKRAWLHGLAMGDF